VRHAALRCVGMLCMYFGTPDALNEDGQLGDASEAGAAAGHAGHAAGGLQGRAARGAKETIQTIQEAAGDVLLPALIDALSGRNNDAPRLRGLAAAALCNFLMPDACPTEVVAPYMQQLMAGLYSVLQEVPLVSVRAMRCAPIASPAPCLLPVG
jgi:hypothetical protein